MNSTTPVSTLLARLEHVHELRPGQWRAKTPCRDGKSTDSLSIAVTDDGTVLLHDHGGASTKEIAESIGLEFKDLFPPSDFTREERRDYAHEAGKREARLVLRHELYVLQQCNDAHLESWPIIDPDPERRERLAVGRVRNALEAIYG